MFRRSFAAALSFTLLSSQVTIAAPPAKPTPYATGVQLEKAGDIPGALAAFESIEPTKRDWNAKLHIASCKRKLGRFKDAAKDLLTIKSDPAADQATRETAGSDLDQLLADTPKMKLVLTPTTSGVIVLLDGATITVPTTIDVDPGAHVVTAKRGSETVFERKTNVPEATTIEVVVDAPAAGSTTTTTSTPPPTVTPAPTPIAPAPDRSDSWKRPAGFVVGGAGIVALGIGTFFLVRTSSLTSERDDLAASGDHAADDRADSARKSQTIARIGFGVGVIALGTGAYFLLTAPKDPASPKSALRVTPVANGAAVSLEGTW
jgi:serine/threonine-protein kinase